MATLTRDALLTPRFKKKQVLLHSFGGEVFVRQLSGMERVDYERAIASDTKAGVGEGTKAIRSMARLIVISLVDEDNQAILADEDVDVLAETWPFEQLEQIFRECLDVNGLSQDALEDASKN